MNYKLERHNSIREILLHVYDHRELPDSAYNWDIAEIVKECVDAGYLDNIRVLQTIDGRVHLAATRPFVTEKGLEFLCSSGGESRSENTTPSVDRIAAELECMNEEVRKNRAEEKSEKTKDRRFQLFNTLVGALLGSAFTLIVDHWAEITSFLSSLFH